MNAITITIENLSNGNIRATGRHNGRTVSSKDGIAANATVMLAEVMEITCPEHRIGKSEKARQYVQYVHNLDSTVRAAFAFVSSASGGQFAHEVWTNDMADIVGQRL